MTSEATAEVRDADKDGDANLCHDPAIAREYAQLDYLTPCERLLVGTYVAPGAAVLDLGVGEGRTTPYLLARAGRYLGVDYSPEMVRLCREKFPGKHFGLARATCLIPPIRDCSITIGLRRKQYPNYRVSDFAAWKSGATSIPKKDPSAAP